MPRRLACQLHHQVSNGRRRVVRAAFAAQARRRTRSVRAAAVAERNGGRSQGSAPCGWGAWTRARYALHCGLLPGHQGSVAREVMKFRLSLLQQRVVYLGWFPLRWFKVGC